MDCQILLNNFLSWWNTNAATVISIILSGIISVLISHIYFHITNRNGLCMNVILPTMEILEHENSPSVFYKIKPYSKNYYLKYMRKHEREAWSSLFLAYGDVKTYKEQNATENAISSYFEYKLQQSGIEKCEVPIRDEEGTEVDTYENYLHIEMNEICYHQNLNNVLKKYDVDYQEEECSTALIEFFNWCCDKVYDGIRIDYFKDYSLAEVVKRSKITAEWNEKFDLANDAKKKFLTLGICKKINRTIKEVG